MQTINVSINQRHFIKQVANTVTVTALSLFYDDLNKAETFFSKPNQMLYCRKAYDAPLMFPSLTLVVVTCLSVFIILALSVFCWSRRRYNKLLLDLVFPKNIN